jgi:hypothetical protein
MLDLERERAQAKEQDERRLREQEGIGTIDPKGPQSVAVEDRGLAENRTPTMVTASYSLGHSGHRCGRTGAGRQIVLEEERIKTLPSAARFHPQY